MIAACMPSVAPGATGAQNAPAAGAVQVNMYMALDPGELEPIAALIAGYNKDHPESSIHTEVLPFDGFSEKLVTTVAAAPGRI